MNLKVKKSIFCIVFILLIQQTFAQTNYEDKLSFELSISQTEWSIKSQIKANLTIKNISDEKLQFVLLPSFKLTKKGVPTKELQYLGNTFSSSEQRKDSIIVKKEGNKIIYQIRQAFEFSLNKGEIKTATFEISKLAWKDLISSITANGYWYEAIPSGSYALIYDFGFEVGAVEGIPRWGWIPSNKIEVKLNSKK